MRLVGATILFGITLLATASIASSQSQSFRGDVVLSIKGWGDVKAGRGFESHRMSGCRGAWCRGGGHVANALVATMAARPYKGWKFAGWRLGPCQGPETKPECVIDLSRIHPDRLNQRKARLTAIFIPVTPGLTRANPVRGGHSANIGNGFKLRINSATPNAQLTPAPPTGAEYFVANITATYTGGGSSTDLPRLVNNLVVRGQGHHNGSYGVFINRLYNPCPYQPSPALPESPLSSGQSVTGNVCWTVATNDESTLELSSGFALMRPTWFALR